VKIQCTVFSQFWIGSLFFAKTRARKEPEDLNGKFAGLGAKAVQAKPPAPTIHDLMAELHEESEDAAK
jgi:hypothetical protein